ncbi:MAG: cupin domain-containing protein [Lachnospiraceae bacterium]|nr:cupin domain-containing protein [Lachnospiraceae bacterium]
MTLMCILPGGDIGLEIHEDTDQYIRIEMGRALVRMGTCKNQMDFQQNLFRGDGIFIPAGTWHNIINTGRNSLKVSSIYAPPHHPYGTVHRTKKDAEEKHH